MNNTGFAASVSPEVLAKAIVQYQQTTYKTLRKDITAAEGLNIATGLQTKDLEAPSHLMFPDHTMVRNLIPRKTPSNITRLYEWEQVTANNTGGVWGSVGENDAGSRNARTIKSRSGTMKQLGLRDYVGDDQVIYGSDYEDPRALAVLTTMMALMEIEELMDIHGNVTTVGAPPTPTFTNSASGGTLTASTAYKLKVSGLSRQGYEGMLAGGAAVSVSVSGQTAAGTASAASTTSAGATDSIAWIWADMPAAVAYNLWVQQASGNYVYLATTTVNRYTQTAETVETLHAGSIASDTSDNANDYPGLLETIAINAAASDGGKITSIDNAALAAEAIGITAILDMLDNLATNDGAGPEYILGNVAMIRRIATLTAGTSAPILSINITDGVQSFTGGIVVDAILNPFSKARPKISLMGSPLMSPNQLIFWGTKPPFPHARIPNAIEKTVAKEFYEVPFARTDGATDTLVDAFAVRVNQFNKYRSTLGMGVLKNVKATA